MEKSISIREAWSASQVLVVPSDITDRKTAERAISEGLARWRIARRQ